MFMRISFESKGNFDATADWLKRVSSNSAPSKALDSIAKEGTRSLAAKTPRSTGETASGWTEKVTVTGDVTEIAWSNNAHPEAGVNIAKLIELGHGTGTGGYVQPQPYIKEAMKPVWSSVDNNLVKELIK